MGVSKTPEVSHQGQSLEEKSAVQVAHAFWPRVAFPRDLMFQSALFMKESDSKANIDRLAALSDGIFAVAMTLLASNIHLPEASAADHLGQELVRMLGEAEGLVISFAIAAMFWMSHFRLFQLLQKADVGFWLLNFALLFSIVVLPVSTSFETSFSRSPIAVMVLGGNLALISLLNLLLWLYAVGKRLLASPPPDARAALLLLAPAIFSVLVFALSLLTMPRKPELGSRLMCLAFASPLVAHFAKGHLGLRPRKQQ
jgi:uncharacterized membrane protein